jgi:hypothetical protein
MTEGLIDLLVNDSTVQSQVGQNAVASKYKVYPLTVPQTERPPYITVQMTSRTAVPCKGGRPTAFITQANINCYTISYDDCLDLAKACSDAVDNQTYIGSDYSLIEIRHADESESWIDVDGLGLYVRTLIIEAHESTVT